MDIPAPIVGQPVAYPSDTGLIADRLFVGDAEGRIWRIDVSADIDHATGDIVAGGARLSPGRNPVPVRGGPVPLECHGPEL